MLYDPKSLKEALEHEERHCRSNAKYWQQQAADAIQAAARRDGIAREGMLEMAMEHSVTSAVFEAKADGCKRMLRACAAAAAMLLTGCFSTPIWSSDHASNDITTVRVERIIEAPQSTLTIIPPEDSADGGAK